MKIVKKDITHQYPGNQRKRHHMVIMHDHVKEAANILNLNVGDVFYIVTKPDHSNLYFKVDVGNEYIDNLITNMIKGDEIYGATLSGVGENFKRPIFAQTYHNYWIENNDLIKQSHTVPGY